MSRRCTQLARDDYGKVILGRRLRDTTERPSGAAFTEYVDSRLADIARARTRARTGNKRVARTSGSPISRLDQRPPIAGTRRVEVPRLALSHNETAAALRVSRDPTGETVSVSHPFRDLWRGSPVPGTRIDVPVELTRLCWHPETGRREVFGGGSRFWEGRGIRRSFARRRSGSTV